jgi:hypothetical protein
MTGEAQLMLVIVGMHLLGLLCAAALLIPALRAGDKPPRADRGGDDGWGRRPPPSPPPADQPGPGLPLPDARPARIRLRDHDRLPDRLPRRVRRPVREPERPAAPVSR